MNLITSPELDLTALEGCSVAVVGYGSQGRAHALNLRDSGVDVVVGARLGGPTARQAEEDGLPVTSIEAATQNTDVVALLVPDMAQPEVFREQIAPKLREGALVLFAHGFNVHYKCLDLPSTVDVAMVAPKSPGALVRRQYEQGRGVPCLFAVHQDASGRARARTIAYAHGLGGARAGLLETSFAEETETDLFGEQAVLCGGVTELVLAGFETLTEAGYQPELAYFECLHELKLIVDLLYEGGLSKMHKYVSDTATYGDLSHGPRVVDESTRSRMREILDEVRDGTFAREWIEESRSGRRGFEALLAKDLEHPIENVGQALRQRMSWLQPENPQPQKQQQPVEQQSATPLSAGAKP